MTESSTSVQVVDSYIRICAEGLSNCYLSGESRLNSPRLAQLPERKLLTVRKGKVVLHDIAALKRIAGFQDQQSSPES